MGVDVDGRTAQTVAWSFHNGGLPFGFEDVEFDDARGQFPDVILSSDWHGVWKTPGRQTVSS